MHSIYIVYIGSDNMYIEIYKKIIEIYTLSLIKEIKLIIISDFDRVEHHITVAYEDNSCNECVQHYVGLCSEFSD